MKPGILVWVRRHPLAAFFLLGIAVCFAALFPVALFIPQNDTPGQLLSFYLARIGVYSPVLAGMCVARVLQPGRQRVPFTRRLMIFLPVWVIAEIIQTANIRLSAAPGASTLALAVLALPAALLPAFVITGAFCGTDGVKHMLAALARPRGNLLYYLAALLIFPVVHVAGAAITNIFSGDAWLPHFTRMDDLAYPLLVTFFSVLLFSGGINEEAGWRGFAQRRLQAKYNPLVANLILWLLMVVWHIPNDIMQYREGDYLLVRFVLYPFITILFGWVYNRTGGSIWAAAIFHASMNSMNLLMDWFPITTAGNVLLVGLALTVVVMDRMWRKLPAHHPAF